MREFNAQTKNPNRIPKMHGQTNQGHEYGGKAEPDPQVRQVRIGSGDAIGLDQWG